MLHFDYDARQIKLKLYPKVLVKTLLINFTRTDHKLVRTFTISTHFTKALNTF